MAQQDPQLHDYIIKEDESLSDSTTVDTPPSERVHDEKTTKLITRIGSIPMIHYITNNTYLGRFVISTASTTLSAVNKYQPKYVQSYYEFYLQPHVEKANEYGCHSLDLIQEKYPIVNQPTSELFNTSFIDKRIAPFVDSFEATIDNYLPAGDNKREVHETNQAYRTYYLINNARSRIIPHSRKVAVEILQKIQVLQAQLVAVAQQSFVVKKTQSLQQSTQQTMVGLILQVSTLLEGLLHESPEWLRSRITSVVQVAQKQVEIIRQQYERDDIKTLEKVKQVAFALQEQLNPVIEQAKSNLLHYSKLSA